MRPVLVLSLVVAACGGPRPVPPSAPPVTDRAEPPAEPLAAPATRPRPPPGQPVPGLFRGPLDAIVLRNVDGTTVLGRNEPGGFERLPIRIIELTDRKSDYWSPCVRDFVQTQPDAARDVLGEALSLYSTTCTRGPAMRVEFQAPRTGRVAPSQSYLGLSGALQRSTCELTLHAAYRGEPVYAERITLIADGVWWTSQRLDFQRDGGWEIATQPLTRALARVVKRAIEARDTLLRFEGPHGYEDVTVTDEMKQDLRVILDALEAINRP